MAVGAQACAQNLNLFTRAQKLNLWEYNFMNVRVILEWDDEAESFSATCPELNFVSSFGETKETAVENLKDAIALMLEPIPNRL